MEIGYYPTAFPYGDSRRDALLQNQAEKRAREMATQATTLDDRNALMRTMRQTARERLRNTAMAGPRGRRAGPPATDAVAPRAATTAPATESPPTPKKRRNGPSPPTVSGDRGDMPLRTPRDRKGPFAPQLIGQHPGRRAGFDDTIRARYATGRTPRDRQDIVKDLDGVAVSPTLVAESTADRAAAVTAGRTRRRDAVGPIVDRDGIVVQVRGANGRRSPHPMAVARGVTVPGNKELRGLGRGETDGVKFGRSCRTDRKNRGGHDRVVVCVEGRSGFPEALRPAFPPTKGQRGIVPRVRAALKYGTDKARREVVADWKTISPSATVLEADGALDACANKGGETYPTIVKPWRATWNDLLPWLAFPAPIRQALAPTNARASVHRVLRKGPRHRKQDPNAASAWKLLDRASPEASQKGTRPIVGWKAAWNPFAMRFAGRLPTRTTT